MSNTRADLFSDLNDWANRSDLSSISSIMRIAQAMIDRTVRTRSQEFTANLPANSAGEVDLPEGFQTLRGLDIDEDDRFLAYVTLDTFAKVDRLTGSVRREYTIEGEKIKFKPALAEGVEVTLSYFQRLPRLVKRRRHELAAQQRLRRVSVGLPQDRSRLLAGPGPRADVPR